jgi:RNA recognition motif. (a.k.a. RRM, RBD, or RNP domain)
MSGSQNDSASMASLMNQFAGIGLPGSNMASAAMTSAQLPLGASQYFYNPADNTYLVAPAMYPPQHLGATQHAEIAYGSYAGAALPYFTQGAAYPSYLSGFPLMPYTPNRAASYYTDRSDQVHKDVPGLENRRGSYSTNESAPGTPYYGSVSQREQGTQIATVDRSPFGSTPSPQQLPIQHADHQSVKPLPYKTIPINVDLDALLIQHPTIPRAVPAVFTPRESMRTLDQSLSNPIPGNRNVYIRGLHPNTDDETLAAYASRFGKVETSKAIIDTSTGACKG